MMQAAPKTYRLANLLAAAIPFADAASADLPLSRLLRLSLFQVSCGMAAVLLTGTLNRVMIVELGMPAWLVALMVSLPLVFAPLRALIGFKSDTHRSFLGWRRLPYIWFGTLMQWGGFGIMPFALFLLAGEGNAPPIVGQAGAALAFLLVGAGMHTVQTAGLALATDIAGEEQRPRVVALLYVMLLIGMVASALVLGGALRDVTYLRIIQVIQGAAVVTLALNCIAMWRQEKRDPQRTRTIVRQDFWASWRQLTAEPDVRRLLLAVGLGAAAFSMQDVLLEPYGGQVLGLSVGATTALTALSAGGALAGFALAAFLLTGGANPHRLAGFGAVIGAFAFALVILADPLESALMFAAGAGAIGFGGGLFSVGSLTAAMQLQRRSGDGALIDSGLIVGAWGAAQATAAGIAIAAGGMIRDLVSLWGASGALGEAFTRPAAGYGVVYHIEIVLLFAAIAVIGPLARYRSRDTMSTGKKFGLVEFPT